ncbi:MAG: azurin, partial [Gammaproteobacteria bacterium]|nr:azurin [Gammaproteobacteria bacterium]
MNKSSLLLTLIVLLSASNFVAADSCNQVIEGNDMLQFNLKEMVVSSSCSDITVTLKHTGAMPA